MISTHWRTGVESTMDYFDEHLAVGDYYLDQTQSRNAAIWIGDAAQRLGLDRVVKRDDFEAIANNLNPKASDALARIEHLEKTIIPMLKERIALAEARPSASTRDLRLAKQEIYRDYGFLKNSYEMLKEAKKEARLTARMNSPEKRRTFWDVVISPPKDVSVVYAMAGDELSEAVKSLHLKATNEAGAELQKFLGVRERANGANHTESGNVEALMASVLHNTSRPIDGMPDPHLHTHLVIANAVYDKASEEWKALSNEHALEATKYIRQVYYNRLSEGLQDLGFSLDTNEENNDFRLSGLDRDLVDKFSRRHQQIKERADEKMKQGMTDRYAAENLSAIDGRETKVSLTDDELKEGWEKLAGSDGRKSFDNWLGSVKTGKIGVSEGLTHLSPFEALEHAKIHVFENESVVKEHHVIADVLQRSRGNLTLDEAKNLVRNDPNFIRDGKMMTTKAVIREEHDLAISVENGIGEHESLSGHEDFQCPLSPPDGSFEYSEEQKTTVEGVLNSEDHVSSIQGVAGAGKTTLLKEIERGSKVPLFSLAPSGKAMEVLHKEGFDDANTIQQWLINPKLREKHEGELIVVDEAGLISVPEMLDLVQKSKKHGNRILLVGDTKQISPIGRGDAFKLLQDKTHMETFEVHESRRQKSTYKEAVTKLRYASDDKKWLSAWSAFDKLDCIQEAEGEELEDKQINLLANVIEDYKKNPEQLVIASRWETIFAFNKAVRDHRTDQGELGEDVFEQKTYLPVHFSDAQKKRAANYQEGKEIELISRIPGLGKKGDQFSIEGHIKGGVLIRDKKGETHVFNPIESSTKVTVHHPTKIEIQQNDKLLIKRKLGALENGAFVTVNDVDKEGNIIVNDLSGETHTIPADFKHLLHGYAITAHASQGMTVNDVTVLADGMEKDMFYVATTRGKENLKVHTTNRDQLENTVKRTGNRSMATDISDAEKLNLKSTLRSQSSWGERHDAIQAKEAKIIADLQNQRQQKRVATVLVKLNELSKKNYKELKKSHKKKVAAEFEWKLRVEKSSAKHSTRMKTFFKDNPHITRTTLKEQYNARKMLSQFNGRQNGFTVSIGQNKQEISSSTWRSIEIKRKYQQPQIKENGTKQSI